MKHRLPAALEERPRLLRSAIAYGISADQIDSAPVDSSGGDQGAGLISRMAVITRGEALGHGGWIDQEFIGQVREAINASPKGVKARFTHPGLSGDGLGKYTGRVKNAIEDGDILRADLHFSQSAHETPDGDLAQYLLRLADEDPAAFGNSIAFDFDRKAEIEFLLKHGAEWVDSDFGRLLSLENFESPDPDNTANLPHFRLARLYAVDAVDDPAANPEGLFHRGDEIAMDAEKVLAYALGMSSERPERLCFDADPDRIGGFVQRFLGRHKLTLISETGETMPSFKPKTFAQRGAELKAQAQAAQLATKCMEEKDGEIEKDDKLAAEKESTREEDEEAEEGEKDADKQAGYDKSTRTEQAAKAGADAAQLAVGGEAPKGKTPGDEAAQQEEYQEDEKKKRQKGKDDAEEDTPVGSPSSEKAKGIGPMGDSSNVVGILSSPEFRAEGKRYLDAFGESGAVWFAQGKTFEEARELHTARLKSENERLAKENAELQKKVYGKRGEATPLSSNATPLTPQDEKLAKLTARLGPNMARFAAGLQIPKPSNN